MKFTLMVLAFLVLPGIVRAAPNDYARFALHVKAPLAPESTTPLCGAGSYDPNEEGLPCSAYTVTPPQLHEWPGPVVYVMVGRADPVGIEAVSFGIDYQGGPGTGIDPQWVTWTGCTDGNEYPVPDIGYVWPDPGMGTRITWLTCQDQVIGSEGVHVPIGALSLYAYSAASLWLTPNEWNQSGSEMKVVACGGGVTDLLDVVPDPNTLFPKVQFGEGSGAWNPCWSSSAVPVRQTTWGRIKGQYGP